MAFPILAARDLAQDIRLFQVLAPRVASRFRAGQFVIVRLHRQGERIPLTISGVADAAPAEGTVTLVVQGVGKTTRLMNRLGPGDALLDLAGPLGNPTELASFGTVAVVGGGVGAAIAWPVAAALAGAGNRVITVLGARSAELLILDAELQAASDRLLVATEDGSRGLAGRVSAALAQVLGEERVDRVFAAGPVAMMQAVAELTRPLAVPTVASLNPLMVDGTGMCGGCRVLVGGVARFACVDGPEFDAHQVDFGVLARRNAQYRAEEACALARFAAAPEVDLALVRAATAPESRP
jgi:ferredoxin--NADP+ reductase